MYDLASSRSLHRTWATYPDSARAFLELARAFAIDAEFARFMRDNRAIVDSTETRLRKLVDDVVDLEWFGRFWGTAPASDVVLVPGLLNGRASYGVDFERPDGRGELYAITGVTEVDAAGVPTFDASFARTVVHEFNHSFANPLVDRYRTELEEVGKDLYASVADVMRAQAYGSWESMMFESLVRAAVVRYVDSSTGAAGSFSPNRQVARPNRESKRSRTRLTRPWPPATARTGCRRPPGRS